MGYGTSQIKCLEITLTDVWEMVSSKFTVTYTQINSEEILSCSIESIKIRRVCCIHLIGFSPIKNLFVHC